MQIQLKSLAEEMQAIIKGLEKVKQELVASESDGPISETFRKVQNLNSHALCKYSFGTLSLDHPDAHRKNSHYKHFQLFKQFIIMYF